ncbi:hypothetical protein PBI_MYXUS_76 [Mycobacterium phage Myxus]|uniref:Uncharacterized protein n=2 Tax=Fromanvirus packman TaxID=1034142 RepID=A0A1C9M1L4_9CAUD|nr:hypothetical protein PBI_MYXUS_76 [Mycobacterium phage Myxus]AOQ29033.1 hypothetical protein SEA_HORTUMSL17_77 [Mycobacterium phage HortumSL17]
MRRQDRSKVPLTRLGLMFDEVANSAPETVINDPGWIFAQRCESRWVTGEDSTPVTALLVYRSTMVKDTSEMYAPVREMLCGARKMEVLAQGYLADDQMMKGKGEYLVARLTHEEAFPQGPYNLDTLRTLVESRIASALGSAGLVVTE